MKSPRVLLEERPDFHTPLQQTNEQTLTTSKHLYFNYHSLAQKLFSLWKPYL